MQSGFRRCTIREFPEQLGKQLAEVVLKQIELPSLEPQRVTVPTELIKRDSCRPILLAPDVITTSSPAARKSFVAQSRVE